MVKILKKTKDYIVDETNKYIRVYSTKSKEGWRFSKAEVEFNRAFDKNWIPEPAKSVDGKPILCTKCHKPLVFKLGSEKVHKELFLVVYGCLNCGYIEKEPID